MVDLVAMQAEQMEWSKRNFGDQPAVNPLQGMIEEMCEFDEAWSSMIAQQAGASGRENALADVVDAIGDIGIYMLDYLGKRSWSMHQLWLDRRFYDEKMENNWAYLVPLIRKLAHHDLKGRQGIRGGAEKHDAELKLTCAAILAHLEKISLHVNCDFLEVIDSVWQKVRLRDWTKNKDNAHEVAQRVIDVTAMAKSNDP